MASFRFLQLKLNCKFESTESDSQRSIDHLTRISDDEEIPTDNDPSEPFVGKLFSQDRYKVKKLIGEGQFGKVFLVFDTNQNIIINFIVCTSLK